MEMTKIICFNCGIECEKPSKEINRRLKEGKTQFYCSLNCSCSKLHTTTTNIIKNCLYCKKEFQTTTHKKSRKCCSINCARKYSQSKVRGCDIVKISNKIKKLWDSGIYGERKPIKLYDFTCVICNKIFQKFTNNWNYENRTKQTCSDKCYRLLVGNNSRNNPHCGGETGYKKFKYKDIWMDSSWEVDLAKWLDDNNITWKRSKKLYMFLWTDESGHRRRYYPDFYLPDMNIYLDPKNKYKLKKDQYKLDKVIQEHRIVLLYGDLNKIKDEIKNKTGI